MPSAKVSIAWAPGGRLMASSGEGPKCDIDRQDCVSRPLLTLFFQGHVQFELISGTVLESSLKYRAYLLDCMKNLIDEEHLQFEAGNEEEANLAALSVEMVRDGHCVWKFVEAVYLSDANDDRHISLRLASWYKECFPSLRTRGRQMADAIASNNFRENEFWDVVTGLVAAGARDQALEIIQARSRGEDTDQWADAAGAAAMGVITKPRTGSDITPLAVAEAILRECPDDVTAARKDGRWDKWQNHCMEWANSDEMSNHKHIRRFLGLLGGNISHLAAGCQDWSHMLVACCTYGAAQPGIIQSRVSSDVVSVACGEASTAFPPPRQIAGGALTEAAMGNPAGMIINLGCSLNTTWFAAHLCDLLVQADVITETGPAEWAKANSELGIREFYLKEFAGSLERYRGMWRVAAAYYLQCPTVGPSYLASLLSRVIFDGAADPTVEKVLRLCGQQGWGNTARSICEKLGSDCLESGNYGGALAWFARGSLRQRAHEVANEALQNAEMQGPGSAAARSLECVVAALATTKDAALPQSLDFLRVYFQSFKQQF